jgi:DNA adenine methylase
VRGLLTQGSEYDRAVVFKRGARRRPFVRALEEILKLSTPVLWQGGKQRLAPLIRKLLPPHRTYVEPFCGGAAVYFAKPVPRGMPAYREVLNDLDPVLINFWTQLRDNPDALAARALLTLYSERDFEGALRASHEPGVVGAAAFLALSRQSYAGLRTKWNRPAIEEPNAVQKGRSFALTWCNVVDGLRDSGARMQQAPVDIHLGDALAVLDRYDAPDTLFYLDPPYAGTDTSSYVGSYSQADWEHLVGRLERLQGSFVLSHYPAAREPCDTIRIDRKVDCRLSAGQGAEFIGAKTEVLWCRYNEWKPPRGDAAQLACFNGSRYTAQGIAQNFIDAITEEDA